MARTCVLDLGAVVRLQLLNGRSHWPIGCNKLVALMQSSDANALARQSKQIFNRTNTWNEVDKLLETRGQKTTTKNSKANKSKGLREYRSLHSGEKCFRFSPLPLNRCSFFSTT